MRIGIALVLVAGCSGGAQTQQPTTPTAPAQQTMITANGIGTLTAATPATLIALRTQLAGYEVKPVNRVEGLEFQVSQNGETLYFVIPDEDGKILNVHVTSPKFPVDNHPWGIGKTLGPADVTSCECWGDKPLCFKKGEKIGASFDTHCEQGEENLRQKIGSAKIARIVWSPQGFENPDEDGSGGENNPCGGAPNPCAGGD
jgi:hypothetical protein